MMAASVISGYYGASGLEAAKGSSVEKVLSGYLPNRSAAEAARAELVQLAGELASKPTLSREESNFRLDLSKDEESRQRYRLELVDDDPDDASIFPGVEVFGTIWGRGISLALDLMPLSIKDKVEKLLFTELQLRAIKSESDLRLLLKELSGVAKKHSNLAFPEFGLAQSRFLEYWETLGDYVSDLSHAEAVEELSGWVEGDIVHMSVDDHGAVSEEQFLSDFYAGMVDWLRKAPSVTKANDKGLTIDEFSKRPDLLIGSGATTEKALTRYVDKHGKYKKVKKNKTETIYSRSHDFVKSVLLTKDPADLRQVATAIRKRERGKIRWVVSSSMQLFIRMSYVFEWVETALEGHPDSPLYKNKEQTIAMWDELEQNVRVDHYVHVPLDQSHFDWQQSRRMIGLFFRAIENMINEQAATHLRADLLSVWRSVEVELIPKGATGVLVLPGDAFGLPDTIFKIEKGVISGWRITSGVDTIMNAGELAAALALISRLGTIARSRSSVALTRQMDMRCLSKWASVDDDSLRPLLDNLTAEVAKLVGTNAKPFAEQEVRFFEQGDDVAATVLSYGMAAALAAAYKVMNFEVNEYKFFLSTLRDEFLRLSVTAGEVTGYLPRAVGSVLMRNPITRDPVAGIARLREQVSSYNTLLCRGANPARLLHHMVADIGGGNGLSDTEVRRILGTPASQGGAGFIGSFFNFSEYAPLGLDEGRLERKGRIVNATFPGLDSVYDQVVGAGLIVSRDEMVQYFGEDLEKPDEGKDVVEGRVYEPEVLLAAKLILKPELEQAPYRARHSEDLTSLGAAFALDVALRESRGGATDKFTRWILDVWVAREQREFSRMLLEVGRKSVWIDWLKGDLPFKVPVVQGWGALLVSHIHDGLKFAAWNAIALGSDKKRLNRKYIKAAAMRVEILTEKWVSNYPYHFGS
jgi:hypothetical protein